MLYEMVTGQVPFQADTPLAVALKHIHDPLPLPREINPELSPEIEKVILKALAKEPDERYEKAGHLADAFEEALRTEAPQDARQHREAGTTLKPPRRWALVGALAALILAGVITTAILLRPEPTVPPPLPPASEASGAFEIGRALFQDDFEGGASPLWEYQWEPWETKKESGNTFFVANLKQAQEARVQGAENWSDYLLRFDLKFAKPNTSGFYNIGIKTRIAACTITHEQYYGIALAPDLLLYAHDDCGAIKHEQTYNVVLPEKDWHTIEIVNYADRFQTHVNGDQIIDILLEEPIQQGSIAFENYQEGQEYYIDNVVVYELERAGEE
jgi:hypothetical protein